MLSQSALSRKAMLSYRESKQHFKSRNRFDQDNLVAGEVLGCLAAVDHVPGSYRRSVESCPPAAADLAAESDRTVESAAGPDCLLESYCRDLAL